VVGKVRVDRISSRTSRHLRWELFAARIEDGPPSLEPVEGSPRTVLFIEPGGVRIGVRFYTRDVDVAASPLAEVAIRALGVGATQMLEVSTANPLLFREFYGFCCTVADRVQLDRQPAAKAVTETLRAWSALIRQKSLLSLEKQVGLMGELLFLKRLARTIGWKAAVQSWRGPDAQEHDFTLNLIDIEVKTTLAERRLHQIASVTQLLPKLNRPLVLVSIQLTPSSGKHSLSLSHMVAFVLATASTEAPDSVEPLRDQLNRIGWSDDDAPTYDQRHQLRTALLAIPVDGSCPAIVPATLSAALDASITPRIERLSYVIDVDGLGALDGTKAFSKLVFA
jgi:hypothetical protein